MLSLSRLRKVLQRNNLPEDLADDILEDYFASEPSSLEPNPIELFAACEVLGKEMWRGKQIALYRNIAVEGHFHLMADDGGRNCAHSLSQRHELADALIRLARKVIEK